MSPVFKSHANSIKRSGFRAAAALVAGIALSVGAVGTARAVRPEDGSIQMDRMIPYQDFVKMMYRLPKTEHRWGERTKTKPWCCDLGDGRMGNLADDLKEQRIENPDGTIHYRVFVARKIFGEESHNPHNPPETINHDYDFIITENEQIVSEATDKRIIKGKWFDIPDDRVLTADNMDEECPPLSQTCARPSANILWLGADGKIYCYLPIDRSVYNGNPAIKWAGTLGDVEIGEQRSRSAPVKPGMLDQFSQLFDRRRRSGGPALSRLNM